ncbi:SDR family NAD(P)-dependent oxidoreductase [Limibacter armeniacum]|uniref:SDR family oxidoreductase n=1 Tax=Limibacter armeniacum TaxID=466084 RepID=UPI002FE52B88
MKTSGNTILITGGSAGIGFEIAKLFSEKGNKVIITGRNADRLQDAARQLKNVIPFQGDVTIEDDVERLVAEVKSNHPDLNILINNAGAAVYYTLVAEANAYEKASREIITNYLSIIRLTEKLLPLLSGKESAAVVNVTSVAAFRPFAALPTYAASKAALHSYTESLRETINADLGVEVYELIPPLVNTAFSAEIGGRENGIPPQEVAEELLLAFEKKQYLVPVGEMGKEIVKL